MQAGILFCSARRTSVCQKLLSRTFGWFGLSVGEVRACASADRINGGMSALLKNCAAVCLLCPSAGGRPDCAAPLFATLKIPLDSRGEPRGVLRLRGRKITGYLIESSSQAILLLPDDPCELLEMLPAACARLKEKFGLEGEIPTREVPDLEALVTESFDRGEAGAL